MRTPTEHVARDGTRTWKIKFRLGGTYTSQTFRRKQDALTFAAILDGGGVADALAWLDAREARPDSASFGEHFARYVDQLTGVTPRTRADYKAQARRYLDSIERTPITLLSRADIARIVNDLDRAGRSPKTIKNVIHMLSASLNYAVDEGILARNPCRRVKLPKERLEEHEARFLTYEEFAALMVETPEHYRPLVIFLVGTGLRWSEATALQSRHVSLPNGTVTVRQAWKRVPGGFELGPPKSRKSRRTVNAATQALAAVAPLLGKPAEFVFTTPTGRTVSQSNFYNRIWTPAAKRAGLDPRPRIHDLRHTHASWLIAEGNTLEQVQDQLGHESILTTRSVYGHLMPALGVETGRMASAALARALPDAVQPGRRLALAPGGAHDAADADGVAADVPDGGHRGQDARGLSHEDPG
jgi:integrase